jgi:RNA polymerase sporulation-specific sigma factor
MISENDENAYSMMIDKYQPLINKYADYYIYRYNNHGIEKEELIQEGTIGLISAINNYAEKEDCIFYTFANLVIKREMERYIKKSMRYKQQILTNATSINETVFNEEIILEDTLFNEVDLVENISSEIYYRQVLYRFKYELTSLQAQVYELRLNNFSNKEISVLLDINYKSVDNCIRLTKEKFKKYIQKYL